jgi:hypothetical protein
VLASLWERKADGGALIVFDAATFKEVKRIPMDKPVGKYNLYNKITRSEGTSHWRRPAPSRAGSRSRPRSRRGSRPP